MTGRKHRSVYGLGAKSSRTEVSLTVSSFAVFMGETTKPFLLEPVTNVEIGGGLAGDSR